MKSFQDNLKKVAMLTAISVCALPGVTNAQMKAADGPHKMNMPMSNSSSMQGMGLMEAMKKMRAQMDAMKMSGNVDMDFAMMMRAHHQGALDMAKIELASGKDPELRMMAQKTINDQSKEIARLDHWMERKGHNIK